MSRGSGGNTLLFNIPMDQKRHVVHSKDCAAAFCECAITEKPVHGKTLMIGGDESCKLDSRRFCTEVFRTLGIGRLPESAIRRPTTDEAFYYEMWMDTTEAQELLNFQRHGFQDWLDELRAEIPCIQYRATRLFSPFVRLGFLFSSPYTWKNLSGKPYPEQTMGFAQILGVEAKRSRAPSSSKE